MSNSAKRPNNKNSSPFSPFSTLLPQEVITLECFELFQKQQLKKLKVITS